MSSPAAKRQCTSEDTKQLLPGLFKDEKGAIKSFVPRPEKVATARQVTAYGKFLVKVRVNTS